MFTFLESRKTAVFKGYKYWYSAMGRGLRHLHGTGEATGELGKHHNNQPSSRNKFCELSFL